MRFAAFARDPGGANALAPVLLRLTEEGHELDLRTEGWAREVFLRAGLKPLAAEAYREQKSLREADALLTATSWPPSSELRWWKAAAASGVPSLSVLDYWSHYRQRYQGPGGKAFWPTKIASMDEAARREMIADGIPARLIAVTGQPFLERRVSQLKEKIRSTTRPREGAVLFVSQPLSTAPGAKSLGYDEFKCLKLVLSALSGLKTPDLSLTVRAHPKEDPDRLRREVEKLRPGYPWQIHSGGDADEPLIKSRVVIGSNTMLLLESALAGKPVISVQPGLPKKDPFPLSRSGRCPRAGSADGLSRILSDLLTNKTIFHSNPLSSHRGATLKVARLLKELARQRRPAASC